MTLGTRVVPRLRRAGRPPVAPSSVSRQRRPLDRLATIKTKWSVVIVAAVAVTAAMSQIGYTLGWPVWMRPVVAGALALVAVQFLARGMTAPLRDMAAAASAMRQGDYTSRVAVTTGDEVGQLAAAFNDMAAVVAEVDRVQKEFVANASHELRAPVAALRCTIENLVDRVVEPDPETLTTMLAQVEHLSKLVVQLLDLNRLESAPDEGPRELVAVGVLLKAVVAEAELLHPGANIALLTNGPLGVVADEDRLHQLFTNLINNALRFGPLGAEVVVDAEGSATEVVVQVRDQGPGVAPQHQSRVFERFWRADGTSLTGGGGAGLGLAICKRIVDLHRGTIRVSSNHPRGACVTVHLPARTAPNELSSPTEPNTGAD